MTRFAAPVIAIDAADEQRHFAHASVKLLEHFKILGNKARFKDQVLRRIAGDCQLWSQNQFRSGSSQALVSADDLLKIAAQISHSRVNLSKTNLHAALEQIMRNTASSNPLFVALTVSLSAIRIPQFFYHHPCYF